MANRDPVQRLSLGLAVLAVAIPAYTVVANRLTPATGQTTVNAFLVRMVPDVAGRVVEVPVSDNQRLVHLR